MMTLFEIKVGGDMTGPVTGNPPAEVPTDVAQPTAAEATPAASSPPARPPVAPIADEFMGMGFGPQLPSNIGFHAFGPPVPSGFSGVSFQGVSGLPTNASSRGAETEMAPIEVEVETVAIDQARTVLRDHLYSTAFPDLEAAIEQRGGLSNEEKALLERGGEAFIGVQIVAGLLAEARGLAEAQGESFDTLPREQQEAYMVQAQADGEVDLPFFDAAGIMRHASAMLQMIENHPNPSEAQRDQQEALRGALTLVREIIALGAGELTMPDGRVVTVVDMDGRAGPLAPGTITMSQALQEYDRAARTGSSSPAENELEAAMQTVTSGETASGIRTPYNALTMEEALTQQAMRAELLNTTPHVSSTADTASLFSPSSNMSFNEASHSASAELAAMDTETLQARIDEAQKEYIRARDAEVVHTEVELDALNEAVENLVYLTRFLENRNAARVAAGLRPMAESLGTELLQA